MILSAVFVIPAKLRNLSRFEDVKERRSPDRRLFWSAAWKPPLLANSSCSSSVLLNKLQAMQVLAPAKINLSLKIMGRRSDGLHEIETSIAPISLCDELKIEKQGR